MKLKGRTAIVTGAGGGLGRCHALQLASLGAAVVVNDLDIGQAQAVADEISAQGGDAIAFAASVTDEQKIAEMVETAMARFGRVDILVNNAGILRDKSFAKMSISDFRLVLEVHLMGSVICSKAVWDIMREQRFGRIVMTTSSSGLYGNFGQSNYSAAKMGLVGLMQTLALEGDNYNIRVNAIAPTAATSMTEGLLSPDALDVLKPERVSEGLLALVGDDAPTRTILCAGAGHFAAAHITLTTGLGIETGPQTPDVVVASLDRITDRKGEIVPRYGFTQAERELASVGAAAPILANTRP
ncbi:SDR family NAD(P)-dependent oxidoreductase [Rhizobium sp. TRM95796]|uniref:SDR family NAD(P)-dependent oxidoreductase n=1 Tax=Rhizobium sp. TRM95796 TaxID=2979862 RepID=UPI0021E7C66E|nr:SDR family NAD(P)-dependent oxidoreductase [Rhizobium sp. TRM95796]MCV3764984.1 SDR family NAD(P)-dependent oxidoreductase [Rhizobium sp. TRM95796]